MKILSDYGLFRDIHGKAADMLFRELCFNDDYRRIEGGEWKETFVNRFGAMLADTPNVRSVANAVLGEGMRRRGWEIDPEQVYFNTFGQAVTTDRGTFHIEGSLIESYRLTDACLMNLFAERYDDWYGDLGNYVGCGIYRVGREGALYSEHPEYGRCWGPREAVCVALEPAQVLYHSDLQGAYTRAFEEYWHRYADLYGDMLSDLFLAAAIRQYKSGQLSENGFLMAREVYARQTDVQVSLFDVNGYHATDILVIVSQRSGIERWLLYVPGASRPFSEFGDGKELRAWVAGQLGEPKSQEAFRKHFSLYDRQDGISYTGVDNILKKMAAGDASWDPQQYLFRSPVRIGSEAVFETLRDRIRARMADDADRQIKSNSEYYRDSVLGFMEVLLSQIAVFDILLPEVALPVDIALGATTLGLSSDIVVHGDTLSERLNGVGSLVGSIVYTTTNLLPVFTGVGSAYRAFRRAGHLIPRFADEERFLVDLFTLDAPETLGKIRIGDPPLTISNGEDELRLVRLADAEQSLVVLRRVAGNKYVRLDPMSLREIAGERLISEIPDEQGRNLYFSNARIRGGAPYNPFENYFTEVWTAHRLAREADRLAASDAIYSRIKATLERLHVAGEFDEQQAIAHEILQYIRDHREAFPASRRSGVLDRLAGQLRAALYSPDVRFLERKLLDEEPLLAPEAIAGLYGLYRREALGETPELLQGMIDFAHRDAILAMGPLRNLPSSVVRGAAFEVKYIVRNLEPLNGLRRNYTRLPEYELLQLGNNRELFVHALGEAHKAGWLEDLILSEDGRQVFIGYDFHELELLVSRFSSSTATYLGPEALTVVEMLQELTGNTGETGFMREFGTREYFRQVITRRLEDVERFVQFARDFDFSDYDTVRVRLAPSFNTLLVDEERIAGMSGSRSWIFHDGVKEIEFCLDYLDTFVGQGMTHLGIAAIPAEGFGDDIAAFLRYGTCTTRLDALLYTHARSSSERPLLRLLEAARLRGLSVVPIGAADGAATAVPFKYTRAYHKGNVVLNALRALEGKKSLVLANRFLANTSPGILAPVPGLAQVLDAPAFAFESGALHFIADLDADRRALPLLADRQWLSVAPPPGRFLGWRRYGEGFAFVTSAQREAAVFAQVTSDAEAFRQEFREIRDIASRYQCSQRGMCDGVAAQVREALRTRGKELGPGASLSWWQRDGESFANNVHTAPTVRLQGREYVVDASHLQFRHDVADEGVMILPVEAWAEEILCRVGAFNPYLADRAMLGGSLMGLVCPEFTRPRIRMPHRE